MNPKLDQQELRKQNQVLRNKIQQFKNQRMNSSNLQGEIAKFVQESEANIHEMSDKVSEEASSQNERVHELTVQYQSILKKQIELLTINKDLSEKKESQDGVFNTTIEQMTSEYEGKIQEFESKVKANVKRIQEMSGSNIIKRLIKNERFRSEVMAKGINISILEKQSQLEDISHEVEEIEVEINKAEANSSRLDEELLKMRELIDTMKELLENMVKEKENVVKQNVILKEKLKQSEELIEKLLGANGAGNQEYEEDFEQEEQAKEK